MSPKVLPGESPLLSVRDCGCRASPRGFRTAYYAKQVQDKPQFLDVGYAPQVELLRSAQSLRSFVEELTYGYRFGVTLGMSLSLCLVVQ